VNGESEISYDLRMSAVPNDTQEPAPHGWRAELQLGFTLRGERTILSHRKHSGPLVVQRPFYPEGNPCHVYLVHPPGGIVGGDRLRLNAAVDAGAHAVITTPAATKFYRTLPDQQAQLQQDLQVSQGKLEWLPQETILFRDTDAALSTVVRMDGQSSFIGWEQTCYGRPASDELFDRGQARQRFELWIDQHPVLLDRLHIEGTMTTARWGLAGNTVLSTLLAYPATTGDLDAAREHELFACSLVDRVLCCRLLNSDGDAAKRALIALWQSLRPRIFGLDAVLPRIWAT
jgi:urease accessory protein